MSKNNFDYLQQDSTLTLREGLQEYMSAFTHLNKNDGPSEACRWFYCHDCTHVLFGTIPFELRGESINDMWSYIGSDVTFKDYSKFFSFVDYAVVMAGYRKKYKSSLRMYLHFVSVWPVCAKVMIRALRMKNKWQWFEPDQHLDTTLGELRSHYGIKVIAT